ncbi:unnamed protein product [Parnassius mnemosyne]|uniref:Uncharacterized protein n=1 Tax=Parnassius mnemosyne TaxID=213953 RepID=A0AAV1K9H1_9NEOP
MVEAYVQHWTFILFETVAFFLVNKVSKEKKKTLMTIFRTNHNGITTDLAKMNFDSVYSTQNPNIAANCLVQSLLKVLDANTQKIVLSSRKKTIKLWITPGLLRCMQRMYNLDKK